MFPVASHMAMLGSIANMVDDVAVCHMAAGGEVFSQLSKFSESLGFCCLAPQEL